MEALLFIVGLLVGAAVAGLVVQRIMAKRIALLQQQVEIRFKLESELEAARARQEMYVQQMERQTEQLERQTEQIKELETENKDKRALAEALAKEVEMLKKQAAEVARIRDEQFAKETQLRKEQFEEQLETARQQMTNVARQLLEQNAAKLNEQNTEGMQHITKPLRDALGEMRRALHENAKERAGHSASFREEIRLQELADLASMTPTAFSRFFKLRTAKTISEYIIDVRLGHAARMLADSTMTIVEICYQCGFNNISNFNRIFKKRRGCTPSEFRENYHKKHVIV